MKLFNLLILVIFISFNVSAKYDRISYKPAQQIFGANGIGDSCTESGYINLIKYTQTLLSENNLTSLDDESDDDDNEKENAKGKTYKRFLKNALDHLTSAQNFTCSNYLKTESFNLARAIIYSVFTAKNRISEMAITDWLGLIENGVITIPYKEPKKRIQKLGLNQASKEANNLINPITGKIYTQGELAKLNYIQVGNLDIGKNHPMWRDEEDRQKADWSGGGAWIKLENLINKSATKKFSKKCEKLCSALDNNYDLKQARKVLIFDKIKISATSPKIEGKDIYGYNWKVKWGVEAFVEPVVSRIYMKLGGKFSDLTYSNRHGASDLLLILESKSTKSSCTNVNTYEWFVYCMKVSAYKFNPSPYVAQWGHITEKNIDAVFAGVSSIIKDPKIRKKYIGRDWITFKESMVEFSADNVLARAGSGPENRLGFENDRVLRGLSLFAAWIGNDDAKEDNSRSVLYEEDNKEIFAHYWHDLGSGLGATLFPGKINTLKTNTDFMYLATSFMRNSPRLLLPYEFLGHKRIVIPRLHLYKPDSWKKVTYSDGLWMAKKIASLQKFEIEEAVAASNLPKFMQDALVFKLMDRRIRMAKIFGIIFPGVQDSYPITIRYNLTKKEVRAAIAKKFDINLARLEWEINKHKLLKGKKEYFDVVVKDGEIVSCSKSLLINILEKAWYPSGLERRRNRLNYKSEMPDCKFNP